MIRLGLVGADDPRHRWFLAALHRHRAGVRIVGLSEPDPALREDLAGQYDLPSSPDHQGLLEKAAPSMLAVAQRDAGRVVIDGLRQNVDVMVAPPVCETFAELETIADLVVSTGRRVTAAHTYRGHPATRTAQELIDNGHLGRPGLVSLIVGADCTEDRLRLAIMEAIDLFTLATGAQSGTVTAAADGQASAEDLEEARAFGELILTVTAPGTVDGEGAVLEVRRRSDLAAGFEILQIAGDSGAVEWDVRSGLLRSAIGGREPVTVACGTFSQPAEWVLNNLIRKPNPVVSTEHSLATTRIWLAVEAARLGVGEPIDRRS
jgi:predicted dehydrogenase